MIRAATKGGREFGWVGFRVILMSSAEAISIVVLVLITRISPSVIKLGARGSFVYVLPMSVRSIEAFVFASVVRRRWFSIVSLLKVLSLL